MTSGFLWLVASPESLSTNATSVRIQRGARASGTMKVIFLDLDGVLLPGRAHRLPPNGFPDPRIHKLDAVAIDMLRELVAETGAKLVWSTSWKSHGPRVLHRIAEMNGIDASWFHPSLKTPSVKGDRVSEIAKWIAQHEPKEWFALDDDAELQSDRAAELLNDPHGLRRPVFSRYDGVTSSIYTQVSVVLGSDRFTAKYRIGRSRGGVARLYVAYPQTGRLRALSPDRVVCNFVRAGGIWLRLDGLVDDAGVLDGATKAYDVCFENDFKLAAVELNDDS
jgi:hypothetical protein